MRVTPLQILTQIRGCHLWLLTNHKSEVPITPSSGAINSLEWLTEVRKTFHTLDHWLIIEGYNAGTTKWKRNTGQGVSIWAGEQSLQALPDTHVSSISLCSSTRMLSKSCTSGTFGRRHCVGMVD